MLAYAPTRYAQEAARIGLDITMHEERAAMIFLLEETNYNYDESKLKTRTKYITRSDKPNA